MRDFFDFEDAQNAEINSRLMRDRATFGELFELHEKFASHPQIGKNLELFFNAVVSGELFGADVGVPGDLRRKLVWYITRFVVDRLQGHDGGEALPQFAESIRRKDTIVTFNYDYAVERALVDVHGELDYAIPRADVRADRTAGKFFFAGRRLLKLHGSMNWSVCDKNSHFRISVGFDNAKLRREICGYHGCGGFLEPVIVPPVWTKNEYAWQLEAIWKKAFRALSKAEEVVFIGYSLPEFDIYAAELFRQSLWANNKGAPVSIVTPSGEVASRLQKIIDREPTRPASTFEEYAASL